MPYNTKYIKQEYALLSVLKKNINGTVLTSNTASCSVFQGTHKVLLTVTELCNCLKHYHPAAIALTHTWKQNILNVPSIKIYNQHKFLSYLVSKNSHMRMVGQLMNDE
jgi:hypothetical protein